MSAYSSKLLAARRVREAHIQAWRGSALTQAAYCQAHGLNATTFSGWLSVLRAQSSARALTPAPTAAQAPQGPQGPQGPQAPKSPAAPSAAATRSAASKSTIGITPSLTPLTPLTLRAMRVGLAPDAHVDTAAPLSPMIVRTAGEVCIELAADTPIERLAALVCALNAASWTTHHTPSRVAVPTAVAAQPC